MILKLNAQKQTVRTTNVSIQERNIYFNTLDCLENYLQYRYENALKYLKYLNVVCLIGITQPITIFQSNDCEYTFFADNVYALEWLPCSKGSG